MYVTQNMIRTKNLIRDRIASGVSIPEVQRKYADKIDKAIKKDPTLDGELRFDISPLQFRHGAF